MRKPEAAMLTRYHDRRRHIRVPASGPATWLSAGRSGCCDVVDVSPGGIGLRLPLRGATRLGPTLTVQIDEASERAWCLARDARVVRCQPLEDGTAIVGLKTD